MPAGVPPRAPGHGPYNGRVSDVFEPLSSDADVDLALSASHVTPVIVFKHSESCGASWMAEASLAEGPLPAPVRRLVVQGHRGVSDRLARLLGVRHESPQVFILVDGRAAWHSSHAGVTRDRVVAEWERLHAARTGAITA